MSDDGRGPLVEERPEPDTLDEVGEEPRRGMPPIAYPLLAVAFGGALVWSFSRVLLAVNKDQAVAIAILMALNILVGAALIAYGSRVRRRPAAMPFLILAGLAVIGVGLLANFAYGDRGPEKKEAGGPAPKPETVSVTAQGTKFLETQLTFTAAANVTIRFDNKDATVQHNIAIFKGADATGPVVFRGAIETGPKVVEYTLRAPPPGTYFFHCDVHPTQMTGTITVKPPTGGPSAGAPTTVTAQNTAFDPTTVKLTPTGGKVTIHFDNKDATVQHNIAVFKGTDATGDLIFRGDLVTGPATKDYTFDAPPPGTYFFHCDVHPTQMTGTITVS
jgi:plastocyanin